MDLSRHLDPRGLRAALQDEQRRHRAENVGNLLSRAAEGLRPTGPAPTLDGKERRDA